MMCQIWSQISYMNIYKYKLIVPKPAMFYTITIHWFDLLINWDLYMEN